MDQFIRGAPIPRVQGPPLYDIVAPAVGESMRVVVLSEYVLAVETVWTVEPITHKPVCRPYSRFRPWPKEELKPRRQWIGFVGIHDRQKCGSKILRLGPESAAALVRFARPDVGLRGVALRVSRRGGRAGLLLGFEREDFPADLVLPRVLLAPSISLVMGGEPIDEAGVMTPDDFRLSEGGDS